MLGIVAGTVKDASGAVLPGVTVEVASPALIEKVRTAVTDGIRSVPDHQPAPGTYTRDVHAAGFSTVRREGVEVSVGFTATVDAEMRVGAVEETITVTGEAPIVDIQSAAQTRTVDRTGFKEIPSGGSWIADGGAHLGGPCVEHGRRRRARRSDRRRWCRRTAAATGRRVVDRWHAHRQHVLSSNLTNMSLSPLLFDQVDIQMSGQTGETGTNGVILNAIPRSGGNGFSGTAL